MYDVGRAVEARHVQATNPGWVVMWGTGSRRFWAFACWHRAESLVLHAPDVVELLAQMWQAEAEHRRTGRPYRSGEDHSPGG
jgi:hypothetical protein